MTNCIIDKCINIGSITKNSTKNYKSSTLVMTHHLSKPHFGYLVNFTIMSWLFLTVVQFVVWNFFHQRNNLTNRFYSGFKVSDSVSVMKKFKFRWQNRCFDKVMVVTKISSSYRVTLYLNWFGRCTLIGEFGVRHEGIIRKLFSNLWFKMKFEIS